MANNSRTYEHFEDNTTYIVTANYNGDISLIDLIKAALKRDLELIEHNGICEKTLDN